MNQQFETVWDGSRDHPSRGYLTTIPYPIRPAPPLVAPPAKHAAVTAILQSCFSTGRWWTSVQLIHATKLPHHVVNGRIGHWVKQGQVELEVRPYGGRGRPTKHYRWRA